jgi:membrane-bound serine protease (ClpP class)
LLALLLLVLLGVQRAGAQQPAAAGPIYRAAVGGTITSVSTGYLRRALQLAEAANASALLIELSNSGAVLSEARAFAGEIAAARVPVVVYVTPGGTHAGAAGALFLSAAQISALAPGTSFGSPAPLADVDAALSEQTRDMLLDSVAAQLREWNATHGRNLAWIEQAVRAGVVLDNQQASALKPPAVDLVAANDGELLTLLEGRRVTLQGGGVTISALGRTVVDVPPTAWESLRLALADPTVAFVLLVLGVIAIGLEFAAPGTSLFAGAGIVLLAGAALGLFVLPLQLWALGLLVLALLLLVAEFIAHAHGALAVAGVALLAVSALNIIDPAQAPDAVVAVWAIVLVGVALAAFAALALWLALRSRERPISTGQEAMVGKLAEVRQRLAPDGMVFVEGALWQAIIDGEPAEPGEWVRVVATHDLRLIVRRLDAPAAAS